MKLLGFVFLLLAATAAQATEISQDAQRHMARGMAAMEVAKSPADYRDAVKEFSEAVKLAPDWANAWFNLGVAQDAAEQYKAAIGSFKTYLKKAPDAADRDAVETRILKLEYKAEKAGKTEWERYRKAARFSGKWRNFNHAVELEAGPGRCAIRNSGIGESGSNSPNEVRKADRCEFVDDRLRISLRGSGGGAYPFSYSAICEYVLSEDGRRLKGGRFVSGTGVSPAICEAYDFKRVE